MYCIKGNLGHIKASIEACLQIEAYYAPENIRIFHLGIALQTRIAESLKTGTGSGVCSFVEVSAPQNWGGEILQCASFKVGCGEI